MADPSEKKDSMQCLDSASSKSLPAHEYWCDVCKVQCDDLADMEEHCKGKMHTYKMGTQIVEVFSCDLCDIRFYTKAGLLEHCKGNEHKNNEVQGIGNADDAGKKGDKGKGIDMDAYTDNPPLALASVSSPDSLSRWPVFPRCKRLIREKFSRKIPNPKYYSYQKIGAPVEMPYFHALEKQIKKAVRESKAAQVARLGGSSSSSSSRRRRFSGPSRSFDSLVEGITPPEADRDVENYKIER